MRNRGTGSYTPAKRPGGTADIEKAHTDSKGDRETETDSLGDKAERNTGTETDTEDHDRHTQTDAKSEI